MTDEYLEKIQDMNNEELLEELVTQAIGADEEDMEIVNAIKEEISLRMVA